ncbi:hypothetical protein PARHAE_03879 [Paracoccus haematequi]|uniref:Uncharacterized protein n=1 Tax=Paracoccus haematequi TaxID=2491866 RepID=A0A3S4GTJ6_9RHOB|nr:hypothetical protein PARHAE_03879 [Paracoccus haematequi]
MSKVFTVGFDLEKNVFQMHVTRHALADAEVTCGNFLCS